MTDDTENEDITYMQDNSRASGKYTEGDECGYLMTSSRSGMSTSKQRFPISITLPFLLL